MAVAGSQPAAGGCRIRLELKLGQVETPTHPRPFHSIRGGDGGRDDKHRGETRRRKGEVMKKILSMILAVMMAQLRNMDKMTRDAMMNAP